MSSPLIAIVGPTASGKSDLALAIASRFPAEIVNYDSVQLYKGFDIGSAKLPPSQRRGIPHHALDILDAGQIFTAGDYARCARGILNEIRERGNWPVLVGGTGFYLRALLHGLFKGPERDPALRERLEGRASQKAPGYLHRILQKLDGVSAARIHPNDTPKLIRAIEVCLLGRQPMSQLWQQGSEPLTGFQVVQIGLDPPRSELFQRIDARSAQMFGEGLIEEVENLLRAGVPRGARPFSALGYKEALAVIDGTLTKPQAIEQTAQETRRYAKRQLTWFRRDSATTWHKTFGQDAATQAQVLADLSKLFG